MSSRSFQNGEVTVDQAHRGYNVSQDGTGYRSVNPLFMKYTPTNGMFSGQLGYGYRSSSHLRHLNLILFLHLIFRSFEAFLDACIQVNSGTATVESFDHQLATIGTTYRTTAILEAGRRSLDEGGRPIMILYENEANPCTPTGFL